MKKFHVSAFAMTCGLFWGMTMLFVTLFVVWFNWPITFFELMSDAYRGMDATFAGAIAGLVWGFVDAFIGGFVFAWLYNQLSAKMK